MSGLDCMQTRQARAWRRKEHDLGAFLTVGFRGDNFAPAAFQYSLAT
jgi:hypothetical protein